MERGWSGSLPPGISSCQPEEREGRTLAVGSPAARGGVVLCEDAVLAGNEGVEETHGECEGRAERDVGRWGRRDLARDELGSAG